jgi:hypothetical protein
MVKFFTRIFKNYPKRKMTKKDINNLVKLMRDTVTLEKKNGEKRKIVPPIERVSCKSCGEFLKKHNPSNIIPVKLKIRGEGF